MLIKICCLILIFKFSEACYGIVPKFYYQERLLRQRNQPTPKYAVKLPLSTPLPIWRQYPKYHIIAAPNPVEIHSIYTLPTIKTKPVHNVATTTTTSSTTTTTTTPKPTTTTTTTPKPTTTTSTTVKSQTNLPYITDDEFPRELLDVAQNKLGLKSLDEIPSISELGELLGTNSPAETLNYIKQLTSNDQGVALMKAYIESTDYTDNSGNLDNKNGNLEDSSSSKVGDIEEPNKINDEGLVVITDEDSIDDYEMENAGDLTTLKPSIIKRLKHLTPAKPGFMERVVKYMHLNNLFPKKENNEEIKDINEENVEIVNGNSNYNELSRITEQGKKMSLQELPLENQLDNESAIEIDDSKKPILVRESIPFNYPIPLRAQILTFSTTTTTPSPVTQSQPSDTTTVVHLNTPKILLPHVQQLSRVTKIPSKQIEDFLASKPKLLELATKVSRFPIGYDHNSPMEAQVMAAVQRAFEEDGDLKKILISTSTLN